MNPDTTFRNRLESAVRQYGERKIVAASGASRNALMRALAGLPVRKGTIALLSIALDSLEAKASK